MNSQLATALVAFVGTLVTAGLAYRQWRKSKQYDRFGRFVTEEQDSYRELWIRLEAVQTKLRTGELSWEAFGATVQQVNIFILDHSLSIDNKTRNLANQYVEALFAVQLQIEATDDEEAKLRWAHSIALPFRQTARAAAHVEAQERFDRIREALRNRVRKKVAGAV